MVRFWGFTYQEAAEALELSPQTVANHMSLALRDLRTMLADLVGGVVPGGKEGDGRRSHDG